MKASLIARLASFFLVVALLMPAFTASAGPVRAKYIKGGMHRPVYKHYHPGIRWIFQKKY